MSDEKAVEKPVTKPRAASLPSIEESDEEGEPTLELLPFTMDGKSYLRLGCKNGEEINWEGDLWYSKNGKRGAYVGSLLEDGSIDDTAEEPPLE